MKTYIKLLTLTLLCAIFSTSIAQPKVSSQERYLQQKGFVNIHSIDPSIIVDLKYATLDNFTKTVLYDSISNAYLHTLAANKLVKAQKYLKELNPKLTIIIYDAARPLSVQKKMFEVVKGTSQEPYVANPTRTGLHNYGMAADVSICDENGKPLDMGTPFDHLGKEAGINREQEFIKLGILTAQQVKNRELLRKVMIYGGFQTIRGEWWHFNAVSLAEAKKSYKLIE